MSVLLVDMREAVGTGLTIRPIRTMINHATTELFFDDLRSAGRKPDRRRGQGLPLHPRRHERRAHPDRRRMHRRRPLLHRPRQRLRQGPRGVRPADRREPGRPVSRSRAPMSQIAAAAEMVDKAAALFDAGEPCGTEANMAKLLASEASLVRGRHVRPDPRRLRLRRGIRHRAQIPRDAALSGGADLDQPDPQPMSRRMCSILPRSY